MPQGKISSSTKNAQIKRQGHTASTGYGHNPDFKGKVKTGARNISIK